MSTSSVPEIKVIYSASGKTTRAVRPRASRGAGAYPLLVGFLGLLVAGVMFYATWWPINTYVGTTVILKAPIPLSPAEAESLSRAFSGGGRRPAGRIGRAADREDAADDEAEPAPPATKYQGIAARNVIVGTALSWQALTSVAFCVLALAAGAAGSAGSPMRLKSTARVLAGLMLIGLLLFAGYIWQKYAGGWPVFATRYVVAGLMGLALLLGIGFGRGGRRLSFCAGVLVILAAGGSAAGLHLWTQAGALTGTQASLGFMILVFCVHSAFGWLLMMMARRLPTA